MNPWYILIPETLHGLTFALMWSAAVTKVQYHFIRFSILIIIFKVSNLITGIGLVNFAVGFISAVLMLGNAAGTYLIYFYLLFLLIVRIACWWFRYSERCVGTLCLGSWHICHECCYLDMAINFNLQLYLKTPWEFGIE